MATTRLELRTALTYKSDQALTASADVDYYLNKGELRVLRRWIQFDSGRFRIARQTITSDANGVLALPSSFTKLEFIEDTTQRQYRLVDVRNRRYTTGYYQLQYNQTTNVAQLQMIESGTNKASTDFFVYDLELLQMVAATTAQPAIPEEFRDLVATAGAMLFFQDRGASFQDQANFWEKNFEKELAEGKKAYKIISRDPRICDSASADAGFGSSDVIHTVT